jgi:hypothetical protein
MAELTKYKYTIQYNSESGNTEAYDGRFIGTFESFVIYLSNIEDRGHNYPKFPADAFNGLLCAIVELSGKSIKEDLIKCGVQDAREHGKL